MAAFTITSTGDTDDREHFLGEPDGGFSIEHLTSAIAIEGVGTFSVISSTRTFVNNDVPIVGYSRGPHGTDLYDGPTNDAFDTWDMLSSIGPVNGAGFLIQWGDEPVQTDGGVLEFNSASVDAATFQAIVPEPATFTLLAIGVAWFAITLRPPAHLAPHDRSDRFPS